MSGWPVGLRPVSLSPGEEVWLWHQILLSIQQFPHIVPLLLQKHPEELAVHWAGHAHLLIVLQTEKEKYGKKNYFDGRGASVEYDERMLMYRIVVFFISKCTT